MKKARMIALLVCMLCSAALSAAAQRTTKWTYEADWQGKTVTIVITKKENDYEVTGDIKERLAIGNMLDTVCSIHGQYVRETETVTANCGSTVITAKKMHQGDGLNVKIETNKRVTDLVADRIPNKPEKLDILGTWNSNIKYRYTLTPDGYDVVWYLDEMREHGKITIDGDTLHATWNNPQTSGSATGHVTKFDENGRAIRIEWSNGAIFTR